MNEFESNSSSYSSQVEESEGKALPLFFAVSLLISLFLCILANKAKWLHWCHESLLVLVFGIAAGAIDRFVIPDHYSLSSLFEETSFSKFFFTILFPPVIFNCGFTMKQRHFTANAGSISLYAFVGTSIASVITGVLLWACGKYLHVGSPDAVENVMFGALLSCTDTVATMAVLFEINVTPLLHSLIFGESVLNDAVAIIFCSTLSPYVGKAIVGETILLILRDFAIIIFGSVGVGLGLGLLGAFLAARESSWNLATTFQIVQIFIIAYISYAAADALELSGVISIFVCAVVMSHYLWYSISDDSRKAVFQISALLDYLSEMIAFLCIGFLLFIPSNLHISNWNGWLVVIVILLLFLARAISVGSISLFVNLCRKKDSKIPFKYQLVLWWCQMRGVVTLLLALNLTTPHRSLFINTVFVVIFFTNIFIGIGTKPFVLKMHVQSDIRGINSKTPESPQENFLERKESCLLHGWHFIDEKVLKRMFGGKPRKIPTSRTQSRQHFEELEPSSVVSIGKISSLASANELPTCTTENNSLQDTRRSVIAPRADSVRNMPGLINATRQTQISSSGQEELQQNPSLLQPLLSMGSNPETNGIPENSPFQN